ncbi:MAG: hypothetical protein OHK0015_33810 [Chloroflexi bacterium OHK40]
MPTLNLPLLKRALAGLTMLSLGVLITLAPYLSRYTALQAAPAGCPSDGRHLVPWRGGRWYLSGVNLPSLSGGYGADFATVEEWGNYHTYSSAAAEQVFAALRARGVNTVRWWVFLDGRGAPEFSAPSGGLVTGFDATTLPSMADAVRLAERHNLYLVFTLWSFEMLEPDSTAAAKGEHAGGHRNLIVDATARRSFIEQGVVPMLNYPVAGTDYTIGTHPHVLGWDLFNEPEWGVEEGGAVDPRIVEPVRLAEMQRFIAEVAGAIHRHSSQLVTVGSAAMKWNSAVAPGAAGNWWADSALTRYDPDGYLDFYQIHYYGWMEGDGVTWSYSPLRVSWAAGGFEKPTVVGEHAANGGLGLLEGLYGNCYGGAWGWTYDGIDGNGSWADLAEPIGTFNAAHASEVNIIPGDATPPTQPPVEYRYRSYLPLLTRR